MAVFERTLEPAIATDGAGSRRLPRRLWAEVAGSSIVGDRSRALYLENWDRLRVIAAVDTVALHLTGSHALFGFGLPLFLMLSVALGVARPAPAPTRQFIDRRVDRILLPWVFWALVLGATRASLLAAGGQPAFDWLEWPMVLYGPRVHLWFLPFVVVAGLVTHALHRWHRPRARRAHVLLGAAGAVLVATLLFPVAPRADLEWPFDQWLFSMPAVPLGYALGRAISVERELPRLRLLLSGGLAGFLAIAGLVALVDPLSGPYILRFAGGVGLLVAATWLPNRADPVTKRVAPLLLGVYVLHPGLYKLAIEPILIELGWAGVMPLRVAATCALCLAVVVVLRRTPLKRFL
jgi:surface polysaccharide O-acyltransferase-like enzyme